MATKSNPAEDPRFNIEWVDPNRLTPRQPNPRTHNRAQINQIAASIKEFGFTNPILIDEQETILAGHGRIEAAKQMGMKEVPVVRIEYMTADQKRAYVIADNQLALNAGWDENLLAVELGELADQRFDLSITGFEMGEIDRLIGSLSLNGEDEENDIPCPYDGPAITEPGDIWEIGRHRLICGDATRMEVYDRLLLGKKADLVFTDPPYNVQIAGNVSGLGKRKHREFAMAFGEMSETQFAHFLRKVFVQLVHVSINGAIQYVCMDWRHMREVLAAADGIYTELKNLCVWAKSNGGMGSLYRSQHELVFVFKSGTKPHINNVGLGKHGRNRTNIWSYAGANAFSETRDDDLAMHPTVKPLQLVKDALLDCSDRNGLVLDAFAGSGTTLVAAHEVSRIGYGIELDPAYCDVILKRFLAKGVDAKRASSNLSFSQLLKGARHVQRV